MADDKKNINKQERQQVKLTLDEYYRLKGVEADRLNMARENLDFASRLTDQIKELNGIEVRRTTEVSNQVKLFKTITTQLQSQIKDYTSLAEIDKDISKNKQLIYKLSSDISKLGKEDLTQLQKIRDKEAEIQKIEADMVGLTGQELKAQQGKLAVAGRALDLMQDNLSVAGKQALVAQKSIDLLKGQNIELEAARKRQENVNKAIGLSGGLLVGVEKSLQAVGLGTAAAAINFSDINKKLEEFGRELTKNGEKSAGLVGQFRMLGKSIELLGGGILGALLNPLTLIVGLVKLLVDSMFRLDRLSAQLAQNMNMSKAEGTELVMQFKELSDATHNVNINLDQLVETQTAIANATKNRAVVNEKDLITFTKLRKQAALTNDEIMGIYKFSLLNSKTLEQNTKEFLASYKLASMRLGLTLNEKEALKNIEEVSALTLINFKDSPEALAETLAQADALGLSLNEVNSIMDNMLDVESMLEKQFEAQALLGREINIERIQAASLINDEQAVLEELVKLTGSSAEFTSMTRVQQDALAQLFGISKERIAEMLISNERQLELSKQLNESEQQAYERLVKQVGEEEAYQQLQDEGIQKIMDQQEEADKFKEAVKKIQDQFVELAPRITDLMPILIDLVERATAFFNRNKDTIKAIIEAVVQYGPYLFIVGQVLKVGSRIYSMLGLRGKRIRDNTGLSTSRLGVESNINRIILQQNRLIRQQGNLLRTNLGIKRTEGTVIQGNTQREVAKGAQEKRNTVTSQANMMAEGGEAIASSASSAAQTPFVGAALAVAAVATMTALMTALYSSSTKPVGDARIPATGKAMISTREGELFELSNNDDILAGPGINKAIDGQGGGNTAILEQKLDTMISVMRELLAKPTNIYWNGEQITELNDREYQGGFTERD